MRKPLTLVLLASLSGISAGNTSQIQSNKGPETIHVLAPAHVFDGVEGRLHEGWVVIVTGKTISAAGPFEQVTIPGNAQRIELPGLTLLPGLSDIHSHIFLHPYNETLWNDQVLKEAPAYRTVRAVNHVRDTLMAGFTLLRDLGTEGAGYGDLSIKQAIDEGLIPGPRLLTAAGVLRAGRYERYPAAFRRLLILLEGRRKIELPPCAPGRVRRPGELWVA